MKTRKLYNRIDVLRREKGLSRQQLADLVGVNPQTVGYLEREEYNPSLDLALRIAEVFGAPIEFVFSARPMPTMSAQLLARDQENPEGPQDQKDQKDQK